MVAGTRAKTGHKKGSFIKVSPEMDALNRWHAGKFLEVERQFARNWKVSLSGIDLGLSIRTCSLRSLQEAKEKALSILQATGARLRNLQFTMDILGIQGDLREEVLGRWKNLGGPDLETFAPYSFYVLTVDTFFNLGIGSDLISRDHVSNKIDLAYLYYLPFCYIFTSNDSLHHRMVPCFLK